VIQCAFLSEIRNNSVVKIRSEASARVAKLLLELGPSSASVLAESLAMTPTAMRKHLDALEAAGFVTSDEAPFGPKGDSTRGRGRPAKIFALTQSGREFFEASYDEIAVSAVRFIEEKYGKEAVKEFARSRITNIFENLNQPINDINHLVKELSDQGFSASLRPSPFPNAQQLCQHNCPISHVASEFPEFCEVETELIGKSLGVHVTRLSTIATGSAICTTNIPNQTPRRSA
jgi:predicted ArsR family transcriptional regulator